MIEIILSVILGGAIGIGGTYFGYRLARSDSREIIKLTEFNRVASKFKGMVIYELSGLYPTDLATWTVENFSGLYKNLPRINSACAEFRYHVTCKGDFDSAIEAYNKYCRDTTEQKVFTLDFTNSLPNSKSQKDYMDEFQNIVNHLLSFAMKN